MKTQEVQFGGNNYPCRVVESNEGEELLIGSTTLLDALQPGSFNDENEGFASKEAEKMCIRDSLLYCRPPLVVTTMNPMLRKMNHPL